MKSTKITKQSLFSRLRKYVCNGEALPDLTKLSDEKCLEMKMRYADMLLADRYLTNLSRIRPYLLEYDKTSYRYLPVRYDFEDALSERQKALLQFCRDIVDVVLKLDAKDLRSVELLGICRLEKISAYNHKLSKFLAETPHRHVACCILEGLTTRSLIEAAQMGYQPAQDYLAELPYTNKLDDCDEEEMKKRLKTLRQYEWHLKSGRKLGLTIEEIITHDEIYGFFMTRFEPTVMLAARMIAHHIAEVMRKPVKGYDVEVSLYDQPKRVKREVGLLLRIVADLIRDVRDKELGEDWLSDDSLEFSYLMAHAERIAAESAEKRR